MTPEEFLDGLPEPRRSEVVQLDAVIRAAVPELARIVLGGMLGYGPYHYLDPADLAELLRQAAAAPAAKA